MNKNRIKEFEKVKKIIKSYYHFCKYGLFNSRNILGDTMETIFEGRFFTIDVCYYYGYFEVFGTTDDEFKELLDLYYSLDNE